MVQRELRIEKGRARKVRDMNEMKIVQMIEDVFHSRMIKTSTSKLCKDWKRGLETTTNESMLVSYASCVEKQMMEPVWR